MAFTMQNVLDRARVPLNDNDKVRYTDTVLLGYANDAILMVRKARPDMFFGRWTSLPSNLSATDAFPVNDELFPHVADYVTGRAELIDDEHTDSNRAQALIAAFLTGIRS